MQILVENNRWVYVQSLHQWRTYKNVLEGVPTREINDDMVRRMRQKAQNAFHLKAVHIIEPIQTPLLDSSFSFFEKRTTLPPIACMMELKDYHSVKNLELYASTLAVVWFQQEYAYPIDAEILEKIKAIPWTTVAEDLWD